MAIPVRAKDVLKMTRDGELPRQLLSAWLAHHYASPDPILEAYAAVVFFRLLMSAAAVFAGLFVLGSWYFGDIKRAVGGGAANALLFALLLLVVVAAIPPIIKTWNYRGFGFARHLSELARLLGKPAENLKGLPIEEAEKLVRSVLVMRAAATLKVENKIRDNIGDLDFNYVEAMNTYKDCRSSFADAFNVAKQFGLNDASGWRPYFDEAKERMASERPQDEGSAG